MTFILNYRENLPPISRDKEGVLLPVQVSCPADNLTPANTKIKIKIKRVFCCGQLNSCKDKDRDKDKEGVLLRDKDKNKDRNKDKDKDRDRDKDKYKDKEGVLLPVQVSCPCGQLDSCKDLFDKWQLTTHEKPQKACFLGQITAHNLTLTNIVFNIS